MTALVGAGVGGLAMAESPTDAQVREYLDRSYPFIEQNAPPPGRWTSYENNQPGRKWTGASRWSVRHGEAVVRWSLGEPHYVTGAKLADGALVNASRVDSDNWRYQVSEKPRRWVHGTIDIGPDRVVFTPGKQPGYSTPVPHQYPDLEVDLAGDEALRARLLDEDFADALYAYLKNQSFFKEGGDRIQSMGLSGTAGMVANLRGQGDVYTDYYPHGGRVPLSDLSHATHREMDAEEAAREAALTARFVEIKAILDRLGWRRATLEDRKFAAVATRSDLGSWEARPEGSAPDWAARIPAPRLSPPGAIRLVAKPRSQMTEAERARDEEIASGTLRKRLHSLAMSGRISEIEYREMVGRIANIP
ncbi:hypothetical protein JQ633_15845 [Bradyrhizobium tropiciagri]|uniref:hypothetical protein n=1 Tax=Bradyrhizobium tropiciagri TaxID=312253 RepID=UPI001BAC2A8E|nr:hypothetical protein [Bradyrhizobium tropiciagri]MBR0871838.1 hypothetical protein [Bradyrhizobium tropiciagri]